MDKNLILYNDDREEYLLPVDDELENILKYKFNFNLKQINSIFIATNINSEVLKQALIEYVYRYCHKITDMRVRNILKDVNENFADCYREKYEEVFSNFLNEEFGNIENIFNMEYMSENKLRNILQSKMNGIIKGKLDSTSIVKGNEGKFSQIFNNGSNDLQLLICAYFYLYKKKNNMLDNKKMIETSKKDAELDEVAKKNFSLLNKLFSKNIQTNTFKSDNKNNVDLILQARNIFFKLSLDDVTGRYYDMNIIDKIITRIEICNTDEEFYSHLDLKENSYCESIEGVFKANDKKIYIKPKHDITVLVHEMIHFYSHEVARLERNDDSDLTGILTASKELGSENRRFVDISRLQKYRIVYNECITEAFARMITNNTKPINGENKFYSKFLDILYDYENYLLSNYGISPFTILQFGNIEERKKAVLDMQTIFKNIGIDRSVWHLFEMILRAINVMPNLSYIDIDPSYISLDELMEIKLKLPEVIKNNEHLFNNISSKKIKSNY